MKFTQQCVIENTIAKARDFTTHWIKYSLITTQEATYEQDKTHNNHTGMAYYGILAFHDTAKWESMLIMQSPAGKFQVPLQIMKPDT